jgi:Arc/MetJ-type ribon-helix-helix transcriptional regulator
MEPTLATEVGCVMSDNLVYSKTSPPGMMLGMTKSKIAVTLPPTLVARARRAVRAGHADSISAYIAAALEEKTKLDELADMLTEMLAETGGPLTEAERRTADAALGTERRRKRTA